VPVRPSGQPRKPGFGGRAEIERGALDFLGLVTHTLLPGSSSPAFLRERPGFETKFRPDAFLNNPDGGEALLVTVHVEEPGRGAPPPLSEKRAAGGPGSRSAVRSRFQDTAPEASDRAPGGRAAPAEPTLPLRGGEGNGPAATGGPGDVAAREGAPEADGLADFEAAKGGGVSIVCEIVEFANEKFDSFIEI
jgi:hypothetical protein